MVNCVFEIRRGDSRVIGIQQVDPSADDPWTSLRDALRRCSERYNLGSPDANDCDGDEAVVTVGVLDAWVRGRAGAGRRQFSGRSVQPHS